MSKHSTFAGQPAFVDTPRGSRIADFFAKIRAGIEDGRGMASRYDELSRLSKAELARRRLSREDITRVVATGRK